MGEESFRLLSNDSSGPRAVVPRSRRFLDFMNVFKAFIGANYLTTSFAYSQAGYALGAVGMVLVAWLTDFCCALIVDCKKFVLDDLERKRAYESSSASSSSSLSSSGAGIAASRGMMTVMGDLGKSSHPSSRKDATAASTTDSINTEYSAVDEREALEMTFTYEDAARAAYGKWGVRVTKSVLFFTQFGFCVGYFIFLGQVLHSLLPDVNILLCVAMPFPFCLGLSLVKDMRKFSGISMVANICVFSGYVVVLIVCGYHINQQLHGSESKAHIVPAKWSTFPVFLGMTAGAYEGIGCIIPIESSMRENRGAFRSYLHGAVGLMTVILATCGLLGYGAYGDDTAQIIILNFDNSAGYVKALRATLCISILGTFPMQLFPAVQIVELFIKKWASRRRPSLIAKISHSSFVDEDEDGDDDDRKYALMDLPIWLQNIIRVVMVIVACGLGLAFRDYFAYFAAIVGAIGASSLSFILPCLFYNKLVPESKRTRAAVIRNYAIAVIGIVGGLGAVVIALSAIVGADL
eukprot:ANDGO_06623.mRNA.1 Vacuolar amino acid transporter 4